MSEKEKKKPRRCQCNCFDRILDRIKRSVTIPNHPRFKKWLTLAIVTCVCATSHGSRYMGDSGMKIWAFIAICMNLGLSLISLMSYMKNTERFQGKYEGIISGIILFLWTVVIPSIMYKPNEIALDGDKIINPNLYFFTWAAIGYSLLIFAEVISEMQESKEESQFQSNPKIVKLLGLVAASIVVLISSVHFHTEECKSENPPGGSTCKRNDYAISVGVLGLVIPGLVLIRNQKISPKMELVTSFLMALFYILLVGFATFGDGPASRDVNNLWLSTWAGFSVSVLVLFDNFKDFVAKGKKEKMEDDHANSDMNQERDAKLEEGREEAPIEDYIPHEPYVPLDQPDAIVALDQPEDHPYADIPLDQPGMENNFDQPVIEETPVQIDMKEMEPEPKDVKKKEAEPNDSDSEC